MRFFRQPLLHFLVLGGLLYGLYLGVGDNGGGGTDAATIQISAGDIAALTESWMRTWRRPPTPDELVGIVRAYLEEEVLYREALAMGLDRDDTIVRRRLRQKLDFLADDLIQISPPDEATLETYLADNQERYGEASRLTFRQVFIDPARHGDALDDTLAATLAELAAGADPAQVGDPFLLPMTYDDVSVDKLARDLGAPFAEAVVELEPGTWSGPVVSPYGLHLVRVDDIRTGGSPDLAAVREAVERDWYTEQRKQARDAYFRELAGRYDVEIEWPDGVSPPGDVTTWQP
jgi:PPIC-type PPIASE domain